MNINKGDTNATDKTGDIIAWVIIILLMFVLPPAGWILLLIKLGVFANKKVNKKRSRLEKKTGRGLSIFLLLVSIGLFAGGVSVSLGVLTGWVGVSLASIAELSLGVLYILGGIIAFFSRNVISQRLGRYKNYYAFIGGRGIVPISDLVQMAGVSAKTATRDVQAMINNGYIDSGAYIDNELECLVISPEEAKKLRTEITGSPDDMAQPDSAQQNQYSANLAELREVHSHIADETISKKVSRLEELTAKIFRIVEESPEKQHQLKRFMSYYLPTTLKLVRSYATLEKQGVKGDNIMSAKQSIGNILDTLITGFEQQLDQLFKSDAIDIASDINVLENLMQQDGLTDNKPEFAVTQSGTF